MTESKTDLVEISTEVHKIFLSNINKHVKNFGYIDLAEYIRTALRTLTQWHDHGHFATPLPILTDST